MIYRVTDSFFRFWYQFVPKNMMAISSGRMGLFYDKAVEAHLHDFMGQVFEQMCRDWLVEHMEQLPFALYNLGEWWGAHPIRKAEAQLDIVGVGGKTPEGGKQYLIGSCKYRNQKIGTDELELIRDYAAVFATVRDKCVYYIFSKGGFTEELRQMAVPGEVVLLTLEDLF